MFGLGKKKIDAELSEKYAQLESAKNELNEILSEINKKKEELGIFSGILEIQDLGMKYEPSSNCLDEIAMKKEEIQERIGNMTWQNELVKTTREYKIDGSAKKGKKFQDAFCKNLLIGFNSYYEKKKKAVTSQNYSRTKELIVTKFNKLNKEASLLGVEITHEYLDVCMQLLKIELDEKLAKAEEKARLQKERQKLREEEKFIAEAEKERKRLEDERHNLQKLFAKTISEQEQNEIKEKLAKIDKRTEEVNWRVTHYSSGWLYITTTPSMQGIYKCGCTKQLNPLNRLAQLSSASVPFPFECRGLVFSEDVFDLEAKMHRRLDNKRVNKDNKLKEFFFGDPEEAIKILTDEFNEEVRFIDEKWIDNEGEDCNANLYL